MPQEERSIFGRRSTGPLSSRPALSGQTRRATDVNLAAYPIHLSLRYPSSPKLSPVRGGRIGLLQGAFRLIWIGICGLLPYLLVNQGE